MNVYHGICAWAEGQLEGELACPDCPTALAALWGRLLILPGSMSCKLRADAMMTTVPPLPCNLPASLMLRLKEVAWNCVLLS